MPILPKTFCNWISNIFQNIFLTEMKNSCDSKYRWTLKNTLSFYKYNSLLRKLERVRNRIRWGGEHWLLVKKRSRQRPKDNFAIKKSICRQLLSTLIENNAILSGIYKGTWHWFNLFLLQWMGLLLVGLAEAMVLKTAPWNHPYLSYAFILENIHIISTIKTSGWKMFLCCVTLQQQLLW